MQLTQYPRLTSEGLACSEGLKTAGSSSALLGETSLLFVMHLLLHLIQHLLHLL